MNLGDDGSVEVRRFLIDSALGWLRDYGADGLRLDALHSLVDRSERHFVAELVDEVRALERKLGRSFVLIGEYDDHDPHAVTSRERGGWGLDAHWNDDFHHAVHALVTNEHGGYYGDFAGPGALAKVFEAGYALDGGYSPFRKARGARVDRSGESLRAATRELCADPTALDLAPVSTRAARAALLRVVADKAVRLVEPDRARHLLDRVEHESAPSVCSREFDREIEQALADAETPRG